MPDCEKARERESVFGCCRCQGRAKMDVYETIRQKKEKSPE